MVKLCRFTTPRTPTNPYHLHHHPCHSTPRPPRHIYPITFPHHPPQATGRHLGPCGRMAGSMSSADRRCKHAGTSQPHQTHLIYGWLHHSAHCSVLLKARGVQASHRSCSGHDGQHRGGPDAAY
ncbi:hypothetical protein E2C01_000712 [Portunus trituberculatus]|uniref:Uncharacterized protein n=1 Tax=Portunus trituberculatus TaxID=210409 RepID=A0A5B7CIC5_PORTR|nr:hypothetical protein [Portunus trituberculatus]